VVFTDVFIFHVSVMSYKLKLLQYRFSIADYKSFNITGTELVVNTSPCR